MKVPGELAQEVFSEVTEATEFVVVVHSERTHNGGSSKQRLKKESKTVIHALATDPMGPRHARREALNTGLIDNTPFNTDLLPDTERPIQRVRSNAAAEKRRKAEGESPSELKQYMLKLLRNPSRPKGALWIFPTPYSVVTGVKTLLICTCDYALEKFAAFIKKGQAVYGKLRCIKLMGDGTSDETRQGLHSVAMGACGTHWQDYDWLNTLMGLVWALTDGETIFTLSKILEALHWAMQYFHQINMKEVISDTFWDGALAAKAAFRNFFVHEDQTSMIPNEIREHTCVQHAKGNTSDHASHGYKKQSANKTELLAFLPDRVFTIAGGQYVKTLREVGKTGLVNYLCCANTGGALHLIGSSLRAPWQSSWTHVEFGYSTYVTNSVESK